jgi:hypothetical protein
VADTEMLLRHFEEAEAECRASSTQPADDPKTGKRIVMAHPAYDQCIKASHLFNLLDARGVISVTERQAYIGRVRALAKLCADAFVQTEAGGWRRRNLAAPLPGLFHAGRGRAGRGGGAGRAFEDPTPLNAPGWFDCFDAPAIGAALEAGEATAVLGEREARAGVDRVFAVFPDGRVYGWHQLNGTLE